MVRDSGMAAGPGRHRQRAREWLGRYISGRAGWAGGLILAGGVLRLPATLGLEPAVCTRVSILLMRGPVPEESRSVTPERG
jgi:hypothetical protein